MREEPNDLIGKWGKNLLSRIQEIVPSCLSEADFRRQIEPLLDQFCKEVRVNALSRSEYTLATGGRADAVFNRLVIEYEAPGRLKPYDYSASNKQPIQQVKDYMVGIAKAERHKLERLAGVVFDGKYLIFIRWVEGKWSVEPPTEVNCRSLERFLHWLTALSSGIALTAENLNRDFSIEQLRTQNILSALYKALSDTLNGDPDRIVAKLFKQWRLFFSEAIDYSEAFGGRKLEPLKKWVRKAGLEVKTSDEAEIFFFALHTYFALLVKLLAWMALSRHMGEKLGAPTFGRLATMDSETLRKNLQALEEGGIFPKFGIKNLIEGSFFSWYTFAWNPKIEDAVRDLLKRLDEYDPTTLSLIPEETRDLFKKLYHYMLPREIRHNLGEYYTPDWLAQRLLNQVDNSFFISDPSRRESWFRENWNKRRFLDPACGSGTFLILTIARMREIQKALLLKESEVLETIQQNVVGFDLNPLAVLTARVNYLLAIADLLEHRKKEVVIPVYMADSIKTPAEGWDLFREGKVEFDTAIGKFYVPSTLCKEDRFDRFCSLLQDSIRAEVDFAAFLKRVESEFPMSKGEKRQKEVETLQELYETLLDYHKRGMNGLWAELLKNNFAPLTQGQFDYIVGNPPWVNWEHLPDGYRQNVAELWRKMSAGGPVYLGKKWDISLLMTQVVLSKLLKEGGRLGFVITQAAFKTNLGGRDFRKFRLPSGTPIKVLHIDDMVSLQPFEGASNRTAVMVLEKGKPTTYPVSYTVWLKKKGARFTYDSTLEEVTNATVRLNFVAEPVNPSDPTSPWLTARPKALKAIRKALGNSDYEAHEGVNTGGANAVYWADIVYKRPDGLVVVRNITEGAKVKVDEVTEPIEGDLLYPLLRGRDVQRWKAEPSARIIMTYLETRSGPRVIEPSEMERRYPSTLRYLRRFESVLKRRTDYRHYFEPSGKPFYAMMPRPGSFAPWKVVWRYVASDFIVAVAEPHNGRPVVPNEKLMLVACGGDQEAHYLCATLNSSPIRLAVRGFFVETQIAPHVIEHIRIPRFNPKDSVHRRLAELSQKAHEAAANEDLKTLRQIEAEIDRTAAKLWNLTDEDLKETQRSLAELSTAPTESEEAE
jgi:SAM-dependent methyltransferase